MALFKEIHCAACGKKTNLVTRFRLQDGSYLCGECGAKIPLFAQSSLLKSYTLDTYHRFLDYIQYSDRYLRHEFAETHHYYDFHVDSEHKLFYIGRKVESNTVFFHFRNVQNFDLVFDGKELKEGVIGHKVTGRILAELEMDVPYFHYEAILDKNASVKAEKALFGSKVRYGSPKGMDEFLDTFLLLWKEAILEEYDAEDYIHYDDLSSGEGKVSALQEALAVFMFDDLSEVTAESLKRQRNRLMKVFHSDVSGADTTRYAQRINEAYECLTQYLPNR